MFKLGVYIRVHNRVNLCSIDKQTVDYPWIYTSNSELTLMYAHTHRKRCVCFVHKPDLIWLEHTETYKLTFLSDIQTQTQ